MKQLKKKAKTLRIHPLFRFFRTARVSPSGTCSASLLLAKALPPFMRSQ
jgi:hypothetical protein